MKNYSLSILTIYFICNLFFSFDSTAKDIPRLTSPIIDQTGILSRSFVDGVGRSLKQLQDSGGAQIQLFFIKSLEGDALDDYSIRVVDQWKLGKKGNDNGILFLIALNDRKMRIEVGKGLEGDLTDIISGRIIGMVRPYFKQKQFEAGILAGLYAIAGSTGSELKNTPTKVRRYRRHRKKSGSLFFFFLIIILSFLGRGRRGRGGSMLLLGALLGGSGRGYGGGDSFGGGSSWGGGGFSGGGSSGSW